MSPSHSRFSTPRGSSSSQSRRPCFVNRRSPTRCSRASTMRFAPRRRPESTFWSWPWTTPSAVARRDFTATSPSKRGRVDSRCARWISSDLFGITRPVEGARMRVSEERLEREARLRGDVESIYQHLTEGLVRHLRLAELVYRAAERHPGLVPTRAEIDAERQLPQKEKKGLEIDQGIFLAHVLAHPRCGAHLVHAMSQPKPGALVALDEFRRSGAIDLGPASLDRRDQAGLVTLQNHAFLNAEDGAWAAALETAVDLVLLDEAIEIGILRGAPATHAKYAGRRVFSAGVNLTHLYWGKISLIDYMLDKELGAIAKLYRGHGLGAFDQVDLEVRREKPWI